MKKLAVDYMHPEIGVTSDDGAAFGRNYFTRASAPEMEMEDVEESAPSAEEIEQVGDAAASETEVDENVEEPTVTEEIIFSEGGGHRGGHKNHGANNVPTATPASMRLSDT